MNIINLKTFRTLDRRILWVAVLMIGLHSTAFTKESPYLENSDGTDFVYDDSQDVAWKEQEISIPPPPDDDHLLKLDIDNPPIGFKVYTDRNSVSIGEKDGIIRFWLVLKSSGSRNAMYTGIRCATRQYKTYAYENKWKKGKLNRLKAPEWVHVNISKHSKYRRELMTDYFCAEVLPRTMQQIQASFDGNYTEVSPYNESD